MAVDYQASTTKGQEQKQEVVIPKAVVAIEEAPTVAQIFLALVTAESVRQGSVPHFGKPAASAQRVSQLKIIAEDIKRCYHN